MLDTIEFDLYGINDVKQDALSMVQASNGVSPFAVPEHNELYRKMLAYKGKEFSMAVHYSREKQTWERSSPDDVHLYENSPRLTNYWGVKDRMRFVDEGKVKDIMKAINGKYRVPSSFSDATFFINPNKGCISFNVSIPKYLYGHSLAQFIPQDASDLKFEKGDLYFQKWENQVKHLYPRLRKFIQKFFSDLCNHFEVDCLPNQNYIVIKRLDLCYNMPFKTKEDALRVLSELQKIDKRKRKKKLNSNLQDGFETTHAFKSAVGAYYKIYHKGTEYSESKFGDLKKHLEVNRDYIEKMINRFSSPENKKFYGDHENEIWGFFKAKGQGNEFKISSENEQKLKAVIDQINNDVPYKVNFLKREMDKVLRYEVSLRGAFFANLYKRHCFRRNDKHHQDAMQDYKDAARIFNNESKDPTKITRQQRKNYKMMHAWLNRGVVLVVGDNHSLIRHGLRSGKDYDVLSDTYKISKFEYAHTVIGKHDAVHFSDFFLRQCAKKLKEFIDEFTIDKVQPYDDLMTRIANYNADVEKRVNLYNQHNRYKIFHPNGKQRRKKIRVTDDYGNVKSVEQGALITKASQLLSQTEQRKQKLKKVNQTLIASVVTQLYSHGKSLDQIFDEMNTNKSTKSRLRADLRMFEIHDNTLNIAQAVIMKTDFTDYYWKTSSLTYQNKFYRNPKLIKEDYGVNPFESPEQENIA